MPVEPLFAEIASRCPHVRTGVDIGFPDGVVSARLRASFPGLWMTIVSGDAAMLAARGKISDEKVHRFGRDGTLPFEENQFEVVVLNGEIIAPAVVREIHRILRPAGMLFFTVRETVRRGPDCTLSRLYNAFLKSGYDIISAVRPPWWRFGRDGKTLTICARKKNWREHRPLRAIGGMT